MRSRSSPTPSGYAGLSEMARFFIGGLLTHAPAVLALAAPTHQQLPPSGARLRGARQPGLLAAQPLRRRAHPDVLGQPEGEARRVPPAGPHLQPVPHLLGAAHGRAGRHPARILPEKHGFGPIDRNIYEMCAEEKTRHQVGAWLAG